MANHHVLRRSKVHPLDAEFPWRLGHIVASPSSDAAKAAMNDLQAAKPCCLDAGFSAHLQPLVAASPGACLDPKNDLHKALKAVLSRCRASNLLVEDRFARVGAHGSKRGRAASGLTVMAKHVLAEALSQWSCRAREADRGQSVAPPASPSKGYHSGWHAFVKQRSPGSGLGGKDLLRQLAAEWSSLSPETKAEYKMNASPAAGGLDSLSTKYGSLFAANCYSHRL